MENVVHEGWMVRYGRRKIGKSYFHMRYFVLEMTRLSYFKKKPTDYSMVPLHSLVVDGNCRVEDRGMKTQQGHMVYVLGIYNKKEKHQRMMMAAYNIQDALSWKEKIEYVIDQQHGSGTDNGESNSVSNDGGMEDDRNTSSGHERKYSHNEDGGESNPLLPGTMIGNGAPDSVFDWTVPDQVSPKKHNWRLVKCQNGLRIFEEPLEVDYLPRSRSKAMKAVGVVDATCEAVFELIMSMDVSRYEWDCTFQYGSLVEEVDGHTAVLYHRLQLQSCSMFVWPRDLCYVRYWRRNDDGSYVVLFRSREHPSCGRHPGFVRAHLESGGFKITPLKARNGRPRTQVQHFTQIDLRGWFIRYFPSFQQHCVLQVLSIVAGMRELFAQTDEICTAHMIPIMVSVTSGTTGSKRQRQTQEISIQPNQSLDQVFTENRHPLILDDDSDEEEDYQQPDADEYASESSKTGSNSNAKHAAESEEGEDDNWDNFDASCFPGNLRRDDGDNARNCWKVPDGNFFKVRGANFLIDKSKIPGGKFLMQLAAVDWLKSTKRMDHVAKRADCAAQVASEKGLFSLVVNLQVPGATHHSMVFYYVKKTLKPGSLLQRFADGDDEFRNNRFKLIPSVPKGSWIVRQSVGSTPCLLGKAVDCFYFRGEKYLEIDVDIGSSAVANGVLGLVFGVVTSLVIDIAFLIQGVTADELPERLLGAVRVAHVEPASATVVDLAVADGPPPAVE